jgi:uncharacterized membrane protein SpoIIM required for sporulation
MTEYLKFWLAKELVPLGFVALILVGVFGFMFSWALIDFCKRKFRRIAKAQPKEK